MTTATRIAPTPMAVNDTALDSFAAAVYRLRLAFSNNRYLLGCSLLHLRHPIPEEQWIFINQWRQGRLPVTPSQGERIRKSLICLLAASGQSLGLLILQVFWGSLLRKKLKEKPVDVLLKTWYVSEDFLEKPADFYFGTLTQELRQLGLHSLLLAGDGRSDGGSIISRLKRYISTFILIRKMLNNSHFRYVQESILVPFWSPLQGALHQIKLNFELFRYAEQTSDPLQKSLALAASRDCLRAFTTQNNLYFDLSKEAVKTCMPSSFITLYEGHPWESLAWHGVREGSPSCRLMGYQHTIVLNHSIELTRRIKLSQEMPAPDVVLSTGETTKAMMEPGHQALGTRFIPFGSYRHSGNAAETTPTPHPERRTILVLPEGNLAESKRIFDFALCAAPLLPDHHFIFRCHPMLPFEKVRPHLKSRPESLQNVEISSRQWIDEDFRRSSILLYRGSSAVLYAVLQGLKPIYIHISDYYDMDPLFELTEWRQTVENPENLRLILVEFAEEGTSLSSVKACRQAAAYVQGYTQPVDVQALRKVL